MTENLGCDASIAAVKRRVTILAGRGVRGRGHGRLAAAPIAAAESGDARVALDVRSREEIAAHRRQLAAALGAELPAASPERIERALAAEGTDPAVMLAQTTGYSKEEIDEVFEAMARHAREAVLRN